MAIAFGFPKGKHRFLRGQKKRVALAARQEFDLRIRLPLICFKTQGQLAVTFDRAWTALPGPRSACGSRFLRLRHDKESSPGSQQRQHTYTNNETAHPEFHGRPPLVMGLDVVDSSAKRHQSCRLVPWLIYFVMSSTMRCTNNSFRSTACLARPPPNCPLSSNRTRARREIAAGALLKPPSWLPEPVSPPPLK